MRKNLDFHLSHEDYQCLRFLWQWKLLSTAALTIGVYGKRSVEAVYKRLLRLEQIKLIKAISSNTGNSYVWYLQDLGFHFVSNTMSGLQHDGYKSENKAHDFLVSAIHLGDWLRELPKDCGIFSEQQLRRMHPDSFPEWVPRSIDHRPDGWWNIAVNQSSPEGLIALEVELSCKTPIEYRDVGEFYSMSVQPYQVIWVTKTKADYKYIESHMRGGSKSNCSEQSYITLSQVIQNQWQSRIEHGKNIGKSIAEILGTSAGPLCLQGDSSALFDTRKKRTKSTSPMKTDFLEDGVSSRFMFL